MNKKKPQKSSQQFFEKYDDHNDPPMNVTPVKKQPPQEITNNYVLNTFEKEEKQLMPLDQQLQRITLDSQKPIPIVRPQSRNNSMSKQPAQNVSQTSQQPIAAPSPLSQISGSNNDGTKDQILSNFLQQDQDNYIFIAYETFITLPIFKQELVYKSMCNKVMRCKEKLEKLNIIYKEPEKQQLQEALAQLQVYLDSLDNLKQMHASERASAKALLERFSGLIDSSGQELNELRKQIAKYEQQVPLQKQSFIQTSHLQQEKNKNYKRINEEQNYLQYDYMKQQQVDSLKERLKSQVDPIRKNVEAYEANVENNKQQMLTLVQEINTIRQKQSEARDLESQKQMLARINNIQHTYDQVNTEKKLIEEEMNQINNRYLKLKKCMNLTDDLIAVYDEFKEIFDTYKDQKLKMQDYEQIFSKMLDSNMQTIEDVKMLERLQKSQNSPEGQQHPTINQYLQSQQLPNFGNNSPVKQKQGL